VTRKIITAREQCELLQPWLNRTADISGNHNLSLVDFFQWCANEHLRPNRAALEAYSQQSGISVEDFLNISSMLDDMGLDGHYLEILRDASRRFWAMASAEDAYDQKPNKDQRAQVGMPLQQNTSGKWYHVSPHKMEPDTILTPGGGISPYNYNNADMPTQRQKDWVWMDGPSAVRQWYYATLLGQIHQGKENPWAYIYEVEPSEGPHPWNGSGHDGHVAPSARIVREIATDKYNRLPDHLGAQRFWAMADTTKWHPLIKHEPRGKSGIYHITIPDKFSTTGKRLGDISYTRGLKGELQCVWEEDGNFGWKPRKHNESYIDSLIVHPDYQGQGIAQALIERLHKDFPDHKINPGATTPEGHGFTQRILETAPNASDTIAPNYKPHILDDDDVQAFNTNELERLVNAAKIIVGKFFRTSMPAPKNLSFRQHPDYPGDEPHKL
jgi:ribosomal protein S18 acetylase RimI-like enzyme